MSEQAQSPLILVNLDQMNTASDVLRVVEQPFEGYVNLRGSPDNTQFMAAAQSVLGSALPLNSNTFIVSGDYTVLWLGPDEWLIVTPQNGAPGLIARMRQALGSGFAAVTDITGGNTAIDVSGSAARDLLAKGSPIDFHPAVFNVGQCAQTLMAKTAITLYQYSDAPGYKIIIRRSFADYLATWLMDARREFEN